jgi:hypothetical protein
LTANIGHALACRKMLLCYQGLLLQKSLSHAGQVREHRNVCLTAIGVDAVAVAIRAVCHARMYLEVCHSTALCYKSAVSTSYYVPSSAC